MFEKLLMIFIFAVITIGVGVYCRKKSTNVDDFVLGGREVGPWLTAFAYGTSYFSAVVFVGYAGQFGWNFGVAAFWIGLGNAFIGSLMAWVILGRRTRIMTKHLESATMPEFFSKRFNSRAIKIVASFIIFVFLVPYSASVYKGLSGLFSMSFGISFTYCIIGVAVLTAIYVIAGGYTATALNDFIQGIIMIVGICAVIYSVLNNHGGLMGSMTALSQIPSETAPDLQGAYATMFGPDPLGLLGVVILTSLGTWGLPQMVHKFYTIKSEKSVKTGTVISTIFALIIAGGSYFIGSFGRLFYTPTGDAVAFDDVVPTMLGSALPDILIGVVLILVLSASMSTLSSLVITSSSTITLDFIGGIKKNISPKIQVVLIKALCGLFVILSAVIALNPTNLITTLMSISWGALAGSFLGPFLYGLFWKGTTKASVWVSFITGSGITVFNFFHPFAAPTMAGAIAIVCSLIEVPIVSLVTPKINRELVDNMFTCYDETVTVAQKVALQEEKAEA